MTISGLTRGRLVGDDDVARQIIYPRLCRTCGPPLRRAVSFLGSCLQRLSANHFAPSVKVAPNRESVNAAPRCAASLTRFVNLGQVLAGSHTALVLAHRGPYAPRP